MLKYIHMAQNHSLKDKKIDSKRYTNRISLFVGLFVSVVALSIFASLSIHPATQAKTVFEMSLGDKADSKQFYSAMSACISKSIDATAAGKYNDYSTLSEYITEDNAKAGKIFENEKAIKPSIGYSLNKNTDTVGCIGDNSDWINSAIALWGYKDGVDFLCDIGGKRVNGQPDCRANSQTNQTSFDSISSSKNLPYLKSNVVLKIGTDTKSEKAVDYLIHKKAFFAGCLGDPNKQPFTNGGGESKYIYSIPVVDGSGLGTTPTDYYGIKSHNDKINFYVSDKGDNQSDTCLNIANYLSDPANVNAYLNAYKEDLSKGFKKPEDTTAGSDETSLSDSKTTCAIDGIGWIVCPVMSFMATIADKAFNFLATNFLETNSKLVSSSEDSATYNAWKVMRNIANVAFVIAFLIIIFSQLSSIGLDNYGIKKLLPKIIIAAILVNLSFIICQIAVDISNILGYSIKSMLDGLGNYVQTPGTASDASSNGWGWATIIAALLAGGVTLAFVISVPILISALFALIAVVLILLGRTALIVLLVVISPLAFVAFLLPNTEEYFTKWRKTFVSLLLVFPIVSLVFGAGSLAAKIINAASDDSMQQVIAMGVAVIPLFIVPALLKKSIDSVGGIGGKIGSMGDSLGKNAGAGYSNSSLGKHMASKKADDIARTKTGNYVGMNPIRKLRSSASQRLNGNSLYNSATRGYGSQLELARQAQNRSDIKDAVDMYDGSDPLAKAWIATQGDEAKLTTYRAAHRDLSDDSVEKIRRMRQSGQHNKAASFLGAAAMLSASGKGSSSEITDALDHARSAGANDMDIEASRESSIADYRKNGRGDNVADLVNSRPGATTTMSQEAGWAEVSAASTHREGVKLNRNAAGAVTSETAGATSYRNNLESSSDKTIQALRAYENMDSRAQADAGYLILQAANHHAVAATAAGSPPPPVISTIADAKAHFGITT